MELALYHPEAGYYRGGVKTGRGGDFLTSASVGACFGELLAIQAESVWVLCGRPPRFAIIEQGAHDGRLAADVLRAIEETGGAFAGAMRYRACEAAFPMETLAANLSPWEAAVEIERDLGAAPPAADAFYFCNELLDALPVHRIRFRDGAWKELRVRRAEDDGAGFQPLESLEWEIAADSDLGRAVASRLGTREFPDGFTTEICLELDAWARDVAGAMRRGAAVCVDYGYPRGEYYAEYRTEGTLRGYREHRMVADVLAEPSEIDITAHVDLTSAAEAAEAAGLAVLGYTDQSAWLTRLAAPLLERWEAEHDKRVRDRKWQRQFQMLTHPSMMGQAFAVLAFGKDLPLGGLPGFTDAPSVVQRRLFGDSPAPADPAGAARRGGAAGP